jgi:hypothetical protein
MSRVLDRAVRAQDRVRGGTRGCDGRVIQRGGERDCDLSLRAQDLIQITMWPRTV